MSMLHARLDALRGRMALAGAAEDLQRGLAAGAATALLLGAARFLGLLAAEPGHALAAGAAVAALFPLAGLFARRTTARRVALAADSRLGLLERAATALSLEAGEALATPLSPLVEADAAQALARVPAAALRRAFRPRLLRRPLLAAAGGIALGVACFHLSPLRVDRTVPETPLARREKEDTEKAARRVLEEARKAEELAARDKEKALQELAREVKRQAEQMLRQPPPRAEAIAQFQKMAALAREKAEKMAGLDPQKMEALKANGDLLRGDPALEKLLGMLQQMALPELGAGLNGLEMALKGAPEAKPWDAAAVEGLKDQLEQLAKALEKNAEALGDRKALEKALGLLGNPELLRELARRLEKLMETLKEQGWEAAKADGQDLMDGLEGLDGKPLTLTDEDLQRMLAQLEEMQRLAALGKLLACQKCSLTGGT